MAKKTLEVKIKHVWFWTVTLSVLYFVLAAWLKSDGTIFDKLKFYELLKDTLTLTAAFLAPVAAFVLFSDWRQEHHVKSIYSLIDEIKKQTKYLEDTLKQYMYKIHHPDRLDTDNFLNAKESLAISNKLSDLSSLYLEFNVVDQITNEFKEQVNLVGESSKKAKNALDMMDYSKYERGILAVSPNQISNKEEISFLIKFFHDQNKIFDENFKLVNNANDELIRIGKLIKESI